MPAVLSRCTSAGTGKPKWKYWTVPENLWSPAHVNINSGGNGKIVPQNAPVATINGAAAGEHVKHGYDVNYVPLEDSPSRGMQMTLSKSAPTSASGRGPVG